MFQDDNVMTEGNVTTTVLQVCRRFLLSPQHINRYVKHDSDIQNPK